MALRQPGAARAAPLLPAARPAAARPASPAAGRRPAAARSPSRELGPLLSYDAEHGTTLVTDLTAFLEAGGNKALAASRAHLARPTFYQRLALIERILGVSLADPESRTSLHVALLARQDSR